MSWQTLRPTRHRILVKLDPEETEIGSVVKFILPADYRKQPVCGTVYAVGPGDESGPCAIKVGDRIVTGKWNGTPLGNHASDVDGVWWVLDAHPRYVVKNVILPNGQPCPGQEVYGIIEAET